MKDQPWIVTTPDYFALTYNLFETTNGYGAKSPDTEVDAESNSVNFGSTLNLSRIPFSFKATQHFWNYTITGSTTESVHWTGQQYRGSAIGGGNVALINMGSYYFFYDTSSNGQYVTANYRHDGRAVRCLAR